MLVYGTELHEQFYWLFHPAPVETQQAQRKRIDKGLVQLDRQPASNAYLLGATARCRHYNDARRWRSDINVDNGTTARRRASTRAEHGREKHHEQGRTTLHGNASDLVEKKGIADGG